MLIYGKIKSYSRTLKQIVKLETKRQQVISIMKCNKDFHLHDKLFIYSAYQESNPLVRKDTNQMKWILIN